MGVHVHVPIGCQIAGHVFMYCIRAVAPTPAGPAMAGPGFFAPHRFAHAQITLFAKMDVGRANPRLKQLSGAGKSMIAQ